MEISLNFQVGILSMENLEMFSGECYRIHVEHLSIKYEFWQLNGNFEVVKYKFQNSEK